MPEYDLETLLSWRGRTVRDPSGDKIGKLGDLYLDAETDLPAYAGVRTGLFGTHESIVPLKGAEDVGGDVVVAHDAELVRGAPNLGPGAVLSPGEEFALDQHYGTQPGANRPDEEPGTMVRSEEELRVGVTESAPVERVRLKKVLVTEHVETTVPRRREVIQLETDPAPEGAIESVEYLDDDQFERGPASERGPDGRGVVDGPELTGDPDQTDDRDLVGDGGVRDRELADERGRAERDVADERGGGGENGVADERDVADERGGFPPR